MPVCGYMLIQERKHVEICPKTMDVHVRLLTDMVVVSPPLSTKQKLLCVTSGCVLMNIDKDSGNSF